MTKHQYLLRGQDLAGYGAFRERILADLVPRLLEHRPDSLKVTLTTEAPPRLSVIPFHTDKLALLSIHGEGGGWDSLLSGEPGLLGAYRVEESVPVAYCRDWPDGRSTPGIGLLTLLRRNPRLEREAFMREWFGRHTPMSLRIHPLWNYVRNVVEQRTVERSPRFDGIVEEHFRKREDLLNPIRFFGGPVQMLPHMLEVGLHVRRFLDLSSLETYLVEEVHVRS